MHVNNDNVDGAGMLIVKVSEGDAFIKMFIIHNLESMPTKKVTQPTATAYTAIVHNIVTAFFLPQKTSGPRCSRLLVT